jgi:hypothetical protein
MAVLVILPGDFPHEDLVVLGPILSNAGPPPGYIPPLIGLCHPEGFLYDQSVEHRSASGEATRRQGMLFDVTGMLSTKKKAASFMDAAFESTVNSQRKG